ncbi:MAG: hypothetical protein NVSMB6_26470 [Burkholderiaceae bacterium]
MWMESDDLYFSRRARQERQAAMRATHSVARQAHFLMAQRFDQVAEAIAIANGTTPSSQ